MTILYGYLKKFWQLLVLALVLAAINQIFSLLDPWIFRKIIDEYVKNIYSNKVVQENMSVEISYLSILRKHN